MENAVTPENVEKIRLNLLDYIGGTVDEWLRVAHFDQTPEDRDGIQYRISWEHPYEGHMIASVKELNGVEPLVRFGVSFEVSPLHAGFDGSCPDYGSSLDPCPAGCASGVCVAGKTAIGPENDPALIEEMADRDDGVAYCLSCNGQGCDSCHQVGAWREPDEKRTQFTAREIRPPEMVRSSWVPATFLMCLAGDRIRVSGQETDVLRSSSGVWHANNADAWHPTPWVHTELRMDLAANPGFQEYPPNTPCEILMSPERLAVHLLMQTFPGTTVVSS